MLTYVLAGCICIFPLSVLCFKREIGNRVIPHLLHAEWHIYLPQLFTQATKEPGRTVLFPSAVWSGILANYKGVIFFMGTKTHLCEESNGKKREVLCSDAVQRPSFCGNAVNVPRVCPGGLVKSSWSSVGCKWCLEEQLPQRTTSGSPLLSGK